VGPPQIFYATVVPATGTTMIAPGSWHGLTPHIPISRFGRPRRAETTWEVELGGEAANAMYKKVWRSGGVLDPDAVLQVFEIFFNIAVNYTLVSDSVIGVYLVDLHHWISRCFYVDACGEIDVGGFFFG
jgi:hypothetical protein